MSQFVLRFLIGGAVVSAFAALAEILRPKSFAGLFAAAPSIALATLGLAVRYDGKAYAAVEARSMIAGALAFFCYAALASWVLVRYKPSALATTIGLLPAWFAASFALWAVFLR